MDEKELQELVKASGKTDFQILLNAKEDAKRKVMGDPNPANLAAYEKATRMLENFIGASASKELILKTRMDVLRYLKKQNYKIEKSKLYKDFDHGMLRSQADGTFIEKEIQQYIKRVYLQKFSKQTEEQKESIEISLEIKRKELEKLNEEIKEKRLKRQVAEGKYYRAEDFEMEISGRAAFLDAGLRYMVDSNLLDWRDLILENPDNIEIVRQKINQDIDSLLNEYASTEKYHVIVLEDKQNAAGR